MNDGYYQPTTPEGIELLQETRKPYVLPPLYSKSDYIKMVETRNILEQISKLLKGKPFKELVNEVQKLYEQKDDLRTKIDQCLVDKSG